MEIKFRAYSKKQKRMSTPREVDLWNNNGEVEGRVFFKLQNGDTQTEYDVSPILMQFTGFQDMDGNDIFDGDLLEHDMYKKCEVFWCQKTGMWRLRQSYGQAKPSSSPLYKELELFNYKINGNIHER